MDNFPLTTLSRSLTDDKWYRASLAVAESGCSYFFIGKDIKELNTTTYAIQVNERYKYERVQKTEVITEEGVEGA
jgi:hypothetical protein